jgi:drug/metabolite transporter (DMT)-like permease
VPPSRYPWKDALIIRSERGSWFLLFAMLACSVGLVLLVVTNPGEHWGWTYWAGAGWMLLVAAYGGFCVVWHRRHRGSS